MGPWAWGVAQDPHVVSICLCSDETDMKHLLTQAGVISIFRSVPREQSDAFGNCEYTLFVDRMPLMPVYAVNKILKEKTVIFFFQRTH